MKLDNIHKLPRFLETQSVPLTDFPGRAKRPAHGKCSQARAPPLCRAWPSGSAAWRGADGARPLGPGAEAPLARVLYAVRTEAGSTFTPGPMVEETAMRWM
jgi:hypothetical protein